VYASAFLEWFSGREGGPNKMIGAHPEHYIEKATTINGITSVDIVETWGTLLTHYTIPNYGPDPKQPYMEDVKDFPFQAVGEAVLRNGTVIANIHNYLPRQA
jgi:hypothetical protein